MVGSVGKIEQWSVVSTTRHYEPSLKHVICPNHGNGAIYLPPKLQFKKGKHKDVFFFVSFSIYTFLPIITNINMLPYFPFVSSFWEFMNEKVKTRFIKKKSLSNNVNYIFLKEKVSCNITCQRNKEQIQLLHYLV
jgi:hypothetical protein